MTKKQQIEKLQHVAALLFDSKLAQLKIIAQAKHETEGHLTDLAQGASVTPDMPQISIEVANLRYERWADVRRAELNMTLARQTALWLDARGAAQVAFGKTQALDGIKARVFANLPRR